LFWPLQALPAGPSAFLRAGTNVWIDADPGCGGRFYEDVDDCWALFFVLAQAGKYSGSSAPALQIQGVSSVFGNTDGQAAWQHASHWLALLQRHHPDLPRPALHKGRAVPVSQSAQSTPAETALIDALSKAPDHSLVFLMLGPVSNLAAVLKAKPALVRKVRRIIMLGGQSRETPHWLPVNGRLAMRDYNVIKDPLAMQWLLDTQLPIDFVPVQAAFGHWFKSEDLRPLAQRSAALRWLDQKSHAWERFWRIGFGTPGYPPFDLLAAALLVAPQRFECQSQDALMGSFPTMWGRKAGLLLMQPIATSAQRPVYRRCELRDGRALDFIGLSVQ
jgi:inosine-uridine nucleoside N-ribohydrolase